jgi:hypothetical protein
MGKLTEPDDVDIFVGGVQPDAAASAETERFIDEYKKRPDYLLKAEAAEQILAAIGIKAPDYGMPDAVSLLEHWRTCVADLAEADAGQANESRMDKDDNGVTSAIPEQTTKKSTE